MKGLNIFIFVVMVIVGEGKLVKTGYHVEVGIPKAKWLMEQEGKVSRASRIVGGSQVPSASSYPYQAGLVVTLSTGWMSVCGGALISNNRVLTAAHCWWDGQSQARSFTVVLGSLTLFTGGTRLETSDVTVHPSWAVATITFDIAMVKIASVQFTNDIQAIPLPTLADVQTDFAGLSGVASGFGKISDSQASVPTSTTLHHTTLSIITNSECQQRFDMTIHGSHLCTSGNGGIGTCDGDSGGPLAVVWQNRRQLVGIVSFGLGDRCELAMPSVFTRVTAHLTWIQSNM